MPFDTLTFISKKKSGCSHRHGEITAFINGIVSGVIPDYQISAWLMAVCFQGLNFSETDELTRAMTESGKIFSWDHEGSPVVDKHSTGGVGDTVTLIAAPLSAAMGMRMGKHSGRGLGHTGGTIDKLESIPGFRTSLSEREFRKIVDTVGCAVTGQDENMTPADGILYALRDVTGTVEQESLIASSVMSKKLAGGASKILLDVKVGAGAFMKDVESAKKLADLMIKLGKAAGRNVRAIITSMDTPLGNSVGNALEVIEAIEVLKNPEPEKIPLGKLSIEIASRLANMCGFGTLNQTRSRAALLMRSGSALEKFKDMIKSQDGDERVIDDPEKFLPRANKILKLRSDRDGYISRIDALTIGELVRDLGGGRRKKGDIIDPAVGVILRKRPGDKIVKNDIILEIRTNGAIGDSLAIKQASDAIIIRVKPPEPVKLILA